MTVSKTVYNKQTNLIKLLLHALSLEIDLIYDDVDIGDFANEDQSFRIFRTGVAWMEEQEGEMTDATRHMNERITRCHAECFTTPLDPPGIEL